MTTTANTINGTEGNNRLTGTSGNDVINGNGGNDRINGGSGSDTLNGGAGNDELNGGSGNDVLNGGSGSDELEGGSGNDTLIYTLAENNVIGKFTYDEYEGGSGTDTLELRFTRSEWMNTSYQAVLQRYIDWANRSGSSCRWDDDFTFRFGNARLEIEDIEKLVVKVDGTTIENLGINTVDAVDDSDIKISEDSTGKEIYVLNNDKANYLVNDLILKTGPANGSVTLFKVDSNYPSSWYFKYSPNNDYYNYLNIGVTATDSFEYTVTDAKGKQDTATVTVTIEGANDAAIFIGTTEGTLTERGSINNSVSTVVSRTLTVTDVDNITTPTNSFIAIASGESTYGTYSINSSGRWTYVLDNTNPLVNKLNSGGALTDKFEVYSFDGTPQEITITINGSNDDAVIGDLPSNQLTEDSNNAPLLGQIYLSDSLSISDVDNRPLFIQGKTLSQINGGFFNLQSDGKYIYQIENSEIQYLSHGQELTESFTLTAEDGTQKTISFTITGVNDAAEIVAPDEIQVTEDQGVGLDGFITITGGISIADYDNGEASFKTEISPFFENKGTLVLDSNGSYTYSVNNADLQSLNASDRHIDKFTIYAKDSTSQEIKITINGADDIVNNKAEITYTPPKQLVEDTGNRLETSGFITIVDKDPGESNFLEGQVGLGNLGTTFFILGTSIDIFTNEPFNTIEYSYYVDNNNVQYLAEGEIKEDKIIILSTDRTAQEIIISIKGVNDAAEIKFLPPTELTEDENLGSIYSSDADGFVDSLVYSDIITITDKDRGQSDLLRIDSQIGNLGKLQTLSNSLEDGITNQVIQNDITYTYSVENSKVQYLRNNEIKEEKFTIVSTDGTTQEIVFSIKGVNDDAKITFDAPNQLEEDADIKSIQLPGSNVLTKFLATEGTIIISDQDNSESELLSIEPAVSNLGKLTYQSSPQIDPTTDEIITSVSYRYVIENSKVQYLAQDEIKTEIFTITSIDGTTQEIIFSIKGANDEAVIDELSNIQVTEDQGVGPDGFITINGNITITDADKDEASFQELVNSSFTNKGTLILNSNGSYTYSVNNADLQSLNAGDHPNDVFTIYAKDGTDKTISITINGADDVVNSKPEIEGKGRSAIVTELINLDYNIPTIARYAAKGGDYDYLHVRTGEFYVKDLDETDDIQFVNTTDGGTDYWGVFTPTFTGEKNSDGKYLVTWKYEVNDSKLDPLDAPNTGTHSKDQTYTLNFKSGADFVSTNVVMHLDGHKEIEFSDATSDDLNENKILAFGEDSVESLSSYFGSDVMYLGAGDDEVNGAASFADIIYGEDGNDEYDLFTDNSVFFGGNGDDTVTVYPTTNFALIFGGSGNDSFNFNDRTLETMIPAQGLFAWGGEGSDAFTEYLPTTNQIGHWIMDFDPRETGKGGDTIDYTFLNSSRTQIDHFWERDAESTKLITHQANSSHPFLSEGATYYELQVKSIIDSYENWYSVLNLVGTNGTTITLDGLFANQNLV